MKYHIDDKEAIEQLRKAGWTASEKERLCRLRRDYVEQEEGQAAVSHRSSRFIRRLLALLQERFGPSVPWWWLYGPGREKEMCMNQKEKQVSP